MLTVGKLGLVVGMVAGQPQGPIYELNEYKYLRAFAKGGSYVKSFIDLWTKLGVNSRARACAISIVLGGTDATVREHSSLATYLLLKMGSIECRR